MFNKLYNIMIKTLKTKLMLLLGLMFGGTFTTVNAEVVTEDLDLSKGSFASSDITWNLGEVLTVKQTAGNGSKPNSNYISAPRVYKGNILSFIANGDYKIKSVSLTYNNSYYGNSMIAGSSSIATKVTDDPTNVARTWATTSSGTHVVSSVSEEGLSAIYIQNVADKENVQFRPTTISITYLIPETGLTKIATIGDDFATTTLDFEATGTFARPTITFADGIEEGEDYEVEWTSSDNNLLVVDTDGSYIAGSTKGSVDVTLTVEPYDDDVYEAVSKTFTVKIVDPNAHTGLTQDDAFTVGEAIEAIDGGVDAQTEYFVKGIISEVQEFNSNYNSITYWLSDTGTGREFECYSGKGLNGADFASEDDLEVGTEVIVKGKLTKYNSTYEFAYNNEIVWMKADERVPVATINDFSPLQVNVNEVGEFTLDIVYADGLADDDYEVTLTSNNNETLLIDGFEYVAGETAGTVTVTVTIEPVDDENYKTVTETYTITIVDPNQKGTETNPYTVAEVIAKAPSSTTVIEADIYVKGFIVGSCDTSSGDLLTVNVETNMAIADTPTDTENYITVALPSGTVRNSFNVVSKPYNIGVAQVIMKGDIAKYCGRTGIKNCESASKKVAEQVSITSAGMATYYTDCALDFTEVSDMYAYTATVSDDAISFTRVMQVPAKTGVLLRNPAKAGASNVVPVATEEVAAVEGNAFVGTLEDTTVEGDGKYILNNGPKGLGFYKVKADGGNNLAAHRAYLNAGSNTRSFIGFDNDETTGIATVGEGQQTVTFYNLQGVRVSQPTKGLYIVNGKKAIFK